MFKSPKIKHAPKAQKQQKKKPVHKAPKRAMTTATPKAKTTTPQFARPAAFTTPNTALFPFHTQKRRFAAAPISGNVGDVVGFPLADIGEGITEVEVLQWFIKKGDSVEQFQKICEVQSDKANVEITSRFDGIVESLGYEVGQMAQVGSPLLHLKLTKATAGAAPKKTEEAPAATTTTTTTAACPLKAAASTATTATAAANHTPRREDSRILNPPRDKNNVFASPVVRMRAHAAGINLGAVRPTGRLGQILPEDLDQYIEEIAEINANPTPAAAAPTTTTTTTAAVAHDDAKDKKAHKPAEPVPVRGGNAIKADNTVAVTGIQKVMVKTMTAAAAIPTFGFADEVQVDNLIAMRGSLVNKAKQHGVKLSNFAFIIKALSLALDKYPQVNVHVNADCSQITHKGAHNIGLAMDTPKGLLVPNIKNVQNKSILEIGAELNRLQALGAAGKLGPEDLKGGTITLSNIGTIGGTYCTPILAVPEAAICALGKFMTKPAFDKDGKVYPATVMNIGWTADHRALDGATVARFSNEFKNYIENPHEMLLY